MGYSTAGDCFAKPVLGNRSSRSPRSEALRSNLTTSTVGLTPRVFDGRRTDSFAIIRPDGILAVRGCGKDIDKVVSYLRQVAGVSSIAR